MIYSAGSFDAYYGGSESNVLVCLAALGNETEYITAIPDNDLGNAVLRHLRSYRVGTGHIIKRGDNLGMYFLEEGFADRAAKVIYNRKHSEVNHMTEKDLNYDEIFKDCNIFHVSGISFAISENAKDLCFKLVKEAKKRNITVSFDFNYRSKLWTIEEAKKVYREIVENVDILFCSERDLKAFLDTDQERFYDTYKTGYLIVREREVCPDGKHAAKAKITYYKDGVLKTAEKNGVEFSVLERIGGGDAFAGGVLHGLNKDFEDIQSALELGIGCFVLKHTVKGDVFALSPNEVNAYLNDSLKDVRR